jgi:hypothetical protein
VPGRADDPVEVLSGQAGRGLQWVVVASGDRDDLYTVLRVYQDGRMVVPGSGFGGPALAAGSVLNEWHGQTDGLPFFVMARTSPEVDRVVATTEAGTEVTLALSPPVDGFGLRFAAAALPEGERPAGLRAERAGAVLSQVRQWMPPPRPPWRGGRGGV